MEEYIRNDTDRANQHSYPTVYDCVDTSPFYDGEPYIDEKDLIELPPPT